MNGRSIVVRGDARNLPLPDASVDLICTSPPYYGLRSYTDGGQHYDGQIGDEAAPADYVDNLLDCTREWMRVLKPEGSLWINLGDKYSQRAGQFGPQGKTGQRATRTQAATYVDAPARQDPEYGVAPKSLLGMPWRYALGAIDRLGLILRAEVIWSKVNGLPESVTDRVRRSHEQWFHFVKQPRYYSAVDEIREVHASRTRGRNPHGARGEHYKVGADGLTTNGLGSHPTGVDGHLGFNPLGALPGSVWNIAAQPLNVPDHLGVDHFAAFPMEFPQRIIRGWSPPAICTACGEGRRPTVDVARRIAGGRELAADGLQNGEARQRRLGATTSLGKTPSVSITGYACDCAAADAPSRHAVVLDPFGGTGTTALMASVLGRHGISVDRSADYCRIAAWRTTDPGERARALGLPKPPPVTNGQAALFGESA